MKIKITDDKIRRYFFNKVKKSFGKPFTGIRKDLDVSRSMFDDYKNGKFCIPESIFNKLVDNISVSDRRLILRYLDRFPDNYGQVKGGKKSYKLYPKRFEEGRKKGLIKLGRYPKKEFDFKLFKISPEICEMIGAFIGDGFFNCYNNKLYHIEFSGDSRYDLNYYETVIIPLIKSIIPSINPHIYKVKTRNCIRVVFYSKELFCFFKNVFKFKPGVKTYIVEIPKIILDSGDDYIISTIRGIFDTDGGIFYDKRDSYKKPYPRIIFSTISENLYSQLVPYLSKHFKIYKRFDTKRKSYVIEIYGQNQLNKWMSLIGFSNKRHLDKIAPR